MEKIHTLVYDPDRWGVLYNALSHIQIRQRLYNDAEMLYRQYSYHTDRILCGIPFQSLPENEDLGLFRPSSEFLRTGLRTVQLSVGTFDDPGQFRL